MKPIEYIEKTLFLSDIAEDNSLLELFTEGNKIFKDYYDKLCDGNLRYSLHDGEIVSLGMNKSGVLTLKVNAFVYDEKNKECDYYQELIFKVKVSALSKSIQFKRKDLIMDMIIDSDSLAICYLNSDWEKLTQEIKISSYELELGEKIKFEKKYHKLPFKKR